LRSMRPDLRFSLTVKGGRNMTADAMLPILRHELAAGHYNLVLWQTGTVEAVQGLRPDVLHGVLQIGADAADAAHADVVLIDPQFSRFLRANADLNPYETVLVQMAETQAVTLFHRFDLTRGWVSTGQVDLERVSRDERDKTIATLNECLGQALAQYVLAGAGEH
jgi:acyl-CoA thioesterase-1